MTEKEAQAELQKCKEDIVYFMENYCLINEQPIVLSDFVKEFLRLHKEELNEEQIKAVIYAFEISSRFRNPSCVLGNLNNLLDKFPQKKHNLNFTWNLKTISNGDN